MVARASHIHIYVWLPGPTCGPRIICILTILIILPLYRRHLTVGGDEGGGSACRWHSRPTYGASLASPSTLQFNPINPWIILTTGNDEDNWNGWLPACAVITFLPAGQSPFSATADGWAAGAVTPRDPNYPSNSRHKIHRQCQNI